MKSITRLFVFTVSLLFLAVHTLAEMPPRSVDRQTAERAAVNWMIQQGFSEDISEKIMDTRVLTEDTLDIYYIVVFQQGGFVILPADRHVSPILAWSTTAPAYHSILPPPAAQLLDHYSKHLKYLITSESTNEKAFEKWNRLEQAETGTIKFNRIRPLLLTTWGQGQFYNTMCPEDPLGPDGHVVTGCVATAMAQIMKYWHHPPEGIQNHEYNHSEYGLIQANMEGVIYDWDAMPGGSLTDYNDAVATIMFHAGVSVEMDYSSTVSVAISADVPDALIDFFGYDSDAEFVRRSNYSDQEWHNLITSQLDNWWPVYYRGFFDDEDNGGGHAFVCDGYHSDDDGIYHFHINWGWNGSWDGYYFLDNLAPGSVDFTLQQRATINVWPGEEQLYAGSGTENDPYQIFTRAQLHHVRNYLNDPDVHFILMNDVVVSVPDDFAGKGWEPIGYTGGYFKGSFNGNGFVIDSLYINRPAGIFTEGDFVGLFARTNGATIKNLGLTNVNITARSRAGALVGIAENNTLIDNCYSTGSISATQHATGNASTGGLVGHLDNSVIKNSHSETTLYATGRYLGGLAGLSENESLVENSIANGFVNGYEDVGGLVGGNLESIITLCHSNATVDGETNTGGLVGVNLDGIIEESSSAAIVSGQENTGGIAGKSDRILNGYGSIITNTFSTAIVNGQNQVGGIAGLNRNESVISHSTTEAQVTGILNVGGLAGQNNNAIVQHCTSEAIVSGENNVGGFVGNNHAQASIINSHSTADLTGTGENTGGIAGSSTNGSLIKECSYEGDIQGNDNVGGIAGRSFRSEVKDCQSVVIIHANNNAGGLVGDNHGSIIQSCHAMGVIYANNMVGGLAGSNRILFEPEIQSTIADSQSGTHLIANNHVGGIAGHNSYSLINNCLSSGEIEGNQRVGGLIGTHGASVVMYSQSASPVTGTGDMVGGLVGESVDTSVINNCESSGPVQGAGSVGGLAGRVFHDSTTIEHCTSTSDITNTGLYTGGLVGYAFPNALIQHSNHEGNITGSHYTGGLIGYGEHNTNILNSSATGNVTGKNFTGGLAGFIDSNSLINNSFYDGAVQGDNKVGGLAGNTIDMEINYSSSTGTVQGNVDVGGVTGYSFISTINNSFSESHVTAIGNAGGLVGYLYSSHVFQCYSAGNVNGSGNLGGLVGINTTSSSIKESFSTSNVTGTGNNIGGLVGENAYSTLIENSYATGTVQGSNVVGGLTGAMYENATLTNAYSTGAVSGTGPLVGGLVGVTDQSDVTNSYWNIETSGLGASAGGEGLMVNEMIQQNSFETWNFATCWDITEGFSYPFLRWQDEPGEHNYPPEYFTLSMLEPSGQGTVVPEPGNYEFMDGTIAEIAAYPDLGHVFSHWIGDVDDALEASTSITIDEDKDVQAVFTEFVAAGIPFSEDFNGLAWGTIPDHWARTHDYWGAGSSDFGVGDEREMHFTPPWTPETDAFMLITPKLDGTGHSIINLSFRHALNDLVGGYSLKVQASVDEETWSTYWQHDVPPSAKDAIPRQHTEPGKDAETNLNPGKASIPESELIVDLSVLTGEMFYIAFVFDGYTGDTWGWYIDDVLVTNQQLFYKPTNLTAHEEDGQVDLLWDAPPDDTIIGYNVYRNGIKLNPDPINTTSYTDLHTETGIEYYYHVTALYADGESDPSNTIKIFRFEGSGTVEDPWLVSSAVHLNNVRNYLGFEHSDKHFRQTTHIDLGVSPWNDTPGWEPIGFFDMDMFEENGFSGTYDGDHFVIDGLFAFRPTCNEVGLFGYLDGAVIKNLGITNANVTGNYNVGILAGEVDYSTIEYCFTTGYAMAQQMRAGGLAGLGSSSTIKNSYSRAMVITNGDHAAGLVATAFQSTIENSYSTGLVYTSGASGGLISWAFDLQAINSYWDTETSEQSESAGGESRTTAQMTYPYDENTYVDWDFTDVWVADPDHQNNSGYPWLQVKETFIITATAGQGGSITPSGDIHVPHGHDQAFTIAADEGYEIEDVVVDGQSIGATSYYYFGHVVKDHTIHADFSEVTTIIPDHVSVNEYVQHTGEDDCFNAYKTIQLAGNGGHFFVEEGGSVTLIAGESIRMLPGTHAKEGSYLHAYIAPDGPFCEQFDRHFLALDEAGAEDIEGVSQPTHAQPVTDDVSETEYYDQAHELHFNIYPNPGRHVFTLEFSNPVDEKEFTVEVFNIYGTILKRKNMQYTFSLEGHKPGMYLVRVVQGGQARTVRLLKY